MATADGVIIQGDHMTGSATQRRKHAYRQDLELQMKEREAARLRERYQDMNVNASGWLDPEKRPDRLKPLGGAGFMTDRSERDSKVRPYHTLFLYDRVTDRDGQPLPRYYETRRRYPATSYVRSIRDPETLHIRSWDLHVDPVAPLIHKPLTEATASRAPAVNDSVNMAYNFYATRDIDRPGNYGSIVQPLVVPYVDNRPIIMPGNYNARPHSHHAPKYNPFDNKDNTVYELRNLIARLEQDRNRNTLAKDQDEIARRLRRELEDERRRNGDSDAKRRVEEIRQEMEARRREWERQKLEAERAKKQKSDMPKTAPATQRPSSSSIQNEMNDQRRRLIDERRKIEELLRAQRSEPNYGQVKVLKRPPPPPTPSDSDLANRRIVEDFTQLKYKDDKETRKQVQTMYPEKPRTNRKLEAQQRALIRQQEEALMLLAKGNISWNHFRRPDWMDKPATPFPHRLRERDRLYHNLDTDVDRLYSLAARRDRALDSLQRSFESDKVDEYERLKLSHWRPVSAETLADESWMRPASTSAL